MMSSSDSDEVENEVLFQTSISENVDYQTLNINCQSKAHIEEIDLKDLRQEHGFAHNKVGYGLELI